MFTGGLSNPLFVGIVWVIAIFGGKSKENRPFCAIEKPAPWGHAGAGFKNRPRGTDEARYR